MTLSFSAYFGRGSSCGRGGNRCTSATNKFEASDDRSSVDDWSAEMGKYLRDLKIF